jgi:processive 1,2-diacylglycerol beta-glucosyltransferase
VPPKILIVTASVGEGHDLPARTLAEQLRAERPGVEIETVDGLAPMGKAIVAVSESAPRLVFFRFGWLWDIGFWVFAGFPPTRRLTQAALTRVGGRGLLRVVEAHRPDVVVSTYPHTTEVLGRLRRDGRLSVPLCAAVTDLAALRYWATPGADVHLVTHSESIEELRRIAGSSARAHCVTGLTDPAFAEARGKKDARRALGLPVSGKIVLVSGGGWGVGRIDVAVEVALELSEVDLVVCLCGRNEGLRRRLERTFGGRKRIRIEGFTEAMPDWLAAADALVHSTGGLTILEAIIRGCPAISFGWGRGHIRANNAAYRRFGLAQVAESRDELGSALAQALETRRSPDLDYARLASGASIVLAQAHDGTRPRQEPPGNQEQRERGNNRASVERRVTPALTADERSEDHRDGDLHREDGRPDA